MQIQLVVMGVSGCGKSTVGQALADRWLLPFIEGDRLHCDANVAKMARGTPLTDDDRWPWLDRVGTELSVNLQAVASCSALRRSYRDRLRQAVGPNLRFVMVDLPRHTLLERMGARAGHYMPASLLDSQLETLERPQPDEPDVLVINGDVPVAAISDQVSTWILA